MAGYTRQSLATIINGADITAPPINSEFNQLLAAFNANTGHAHDGSTGSAPKINLTTSITGYLPAAHGGVGGKNKFDATSAPSTSNDAGEGYAPGSMWENTTNGRMYICVGNTSNSAVWREMVTVISSNQITPIATNSVDLGTPSIRFQDAYLSGGLSATGNVAIGGTLTTTGTSAFTGLATFANLSATGTTTITSVDLNSGAIDNAVIGSATPAAGTFTTLNANTSLVAATADINGGTIDGAALGATTPSTGAFTTLGASGTSTLATVDINGGNIDGTVIGASTRAAGSFTTLSTTGQATLASADINGGSIDGSTIGANSASTGAFTTLTASGGITGSLTGNVTGNTAGVHTGNVVGNVTGNLTGNVTAGSGTSTFTNVVVNGNLNMNAGTSATITNLTAPSADLDAATKKYVDDEISTLIGDAGAGLDTLGELADALNDDDAFSTTVTNSIATKLPKAGGTMTGAIAMSTNKITGVGNPTSAQDVSTKVYTDTQRDTRVAKTGDTMSGALAMGNNKITGLATPTAGTDVTNKTYVDGILGSATVAATSATNAATSATNAATSATSSANSAAAALVSQNAAAASYDNFDDRYLGAKSSAPTVDNDGDALITGALYFNTTSNIMFVRSSSGWQAAGSAVNGTSERTTYTATAGQTVFAATYDTGYIDVYLNGVKLLSGTDFTATNGTSITLASGASVNDVVDIVAYGTFELADHYTKTASDARYVNVTGDTMTGNLNVTGTVTADGVKTDHTDGFYIDNSGTTEASWTHTAATGSSVINVGRNSSWGGDLTIKTDTKSRALFNNNGDISFYEDTGTTAKFFWDASAERLGIGTSSPSGKLSISGATATNEQVHTTFTNTSGAKTFAIGAGQSGVTNNGFVIRNVTDNTFPLVISDAGVTSFGAGNVGIGTSSVTAGFVLEGVGDARFGDVAGDDAVEIGWSGGGGYAFVQAFDRGATAQRDLVLNSSLRIDSSGKVGIGEENPLDSLSISSSSGNAAIRLKRTDTTIINNDNYGVIYFAGDDSDTNASGIRGFIRGRAQGTGGGMKMEFHTAGGGAALVSEPRMTLNADGNLLVGKTALGISNAGHTLAADGYTEFTRTATSTSSGSALNVGRNTHDGSLATFWKNGSAVGSISTKSDDLVIHSSTTNHVGLSFGDGNVIPTNNYGTTSNNTVDLGSTSRRFKDLYLSGGVDFGGAVNSGGVTSSSNKLDDYEEGTWTPTLLGASSNPTVGYLLQTGYYTKIGNTVNLYCRLQTNSRSGGSGTALIGGLPFAHNSARAGGGVGYISGVNLGSGFAQFGLSGDPVSSTIRYVQSGDNVGSNIINVTEVSSSSNHDIVFTYTYQTNS